MYICNSCESRFEEPQETQGETLEHFGTPCRETFYECPCCGSEDCEEMATCSYCGESEDANFTYTSLTRGVCEECFGKLKEEYSKSFFKVYKTEFYVYIESIMDDCILFTPQEILEKGVIGLGCEENLIDDFINDDRTFFLDFADKQISTEESA